MLNKLIYNFIRFAFWTNRSATGCRLVFFFYFHSRITCVCWVHGHCAWFVPATNQPHERRIKRDPAIVRRYQNYDCARWLDDLGRCVAKAFVPDNHRGHWTIFQKTNTKKNVIENDSSFHFEVFFSNWTIQC